MLVEATARVVKVRSSGPPMANRGDALPAPGGGGGWNRDHDGGRPVSSQRVSSSFPKQRRDQRFCVGRTTGSPLLRTCVRKSAVGCQGDPNVCSAYPACPPVTCTCGAGMLPAFHERPLFRRLTAVWGFRCRIPRACSWRPVGRPCGVGYTPVFLGPHYLTPSDGRPYTEWSDQGNSNTRTETACQLSPGGFNYSVIYPWRKWHFRRSDGLFNGVRKGWSAPTTQLSTGACG